MKVVFPESLVDDIKNGGYKKEHEGDIDPTPDPSGGGDGDDTPSGGGDDSGGGGGDTPTPTPEVVTDYEQLTNLPKINSVELKGNKSLLDLGLEPLTIDQMIDIANYIER